MFFLGVLAGFVVTSFDIFPFIVGFGIGMGCYEINPEKVVQVRDSVMKHLSDKASSCISWTRDKKRELAGD